MTNDLTKSRIVLIGITVAAYVIVYCLCFMTGLQLDVASIWPLVVYAGGALLLSSIYCSWRQMPVVRNISEPIGLGILLSLPIVVSTYLAMGAGFPLADARLASADAVFGFDWRSFVRLVDTHPWLAWGLGQAYQAFTPQLVFLPILLSVTGRVWRAYTMVSSYALICFSASLIAVWFPAIGAYPYFEIDPAGLQNINAYFGYFFLEQFNAVRGDPNFVFIAGEAAGILTFPSVHAAVATLCVWATWDWRHLRYLFLMLNAGMATAAVTHGSHYLVDVPAGVMLACICIRLVSVLSRTAFRAPSTIPSRVERASSG